MHESFGRHKLYLVMCKMCCSRLQWLQEKRLVGMVDFAHAHVLMSYSLLRTRLNLMRHNGIAE